MSKDSVTIRNNINKAIGSLVKYRDAVLFVLLYQMVLAIFAAMILDGGQCKQYWFVSMIAFWASVGVRAVRKRGNPSGWDLFYIKWGFFPVLFLLTPWIMSIVWRWKGVL